MSDYENYAGPGPEGLGIQATVGETIISLFPEGFGAKIYSDVLAKRENFPDKEQTQEASKKLLLEEGQLTRRLRSFFDSIYQSEVDYFDETIKKNKLDVDELVKRISRAPRRTDEDNLRLAILQQEKKRENYQVEYLEEAYGRLKKSKSSLEGDIKTKYLRLPFTPFDLFAIVTLLLKKSGAYYHVEAYDFSAEPSSDNQLPNRVIKILQKDRDECRHVGDIWQSCLLTRSPQNIHDKQAYIPDYLLKLWCKLICYWDDFLFQPIDRMAEAPRWWNTAFKLLSIADRASVDAGFQSPGEMDKGDNYWAHVATSFIIATGKTVDENNRIASVHTLSGAHRDIVSVLPKARTAQIGCTLRSLSHNLALLPSRGSVRATWAWQDQGYKRLNPAKRRAFNVITVPYPYVVSAKCFEPVSVSEKEARRGRFLYNPSCDSILENGDKITDIVEFVAALIREAEHRVETVHAVVFPELALKATEFEALSKYIQFHTKVELLCAGLRQNYPNSAEAMRDQAFTPRVANQAVMASFTQRPDYIAKNIPYTRMRQLCKYEKHHRWKLNSNQIKDYGLSSSLNPTMDWWEDLHLVNRKLPFVVMRDSWLATTLICEDLARIDPAQEIVRAIGPNLVISILMDGPQLKERWSARYATVLADDPGSAVLTVNSLGLITRSTNVRRREHNIDAASRAIALWKDDTGNSTSLELPEGHHAICLTISEHNQSELSLDGRSNRNDSIALRLSNHFALKLGERAQNFFYGSKSGRESDSASEDTSSL